jgi:hypothetical protein
MHHPERGQPQPVAATNRWRRRLVLGLLPIALLAAVVLQQRQDVQQAPVGAARNADPAVQQPPGAAAGAPVRLADFLGEPVSADARLVANWVVATSDHQQHAFILVDKKDAHAYVFTPEGRLQDSAPVLLGAAVGDEILPGAGNKPPSRMRPSERTTPAGRFVAEPGTNADDEDVIWVDYDNAISMHRVRPWVAGERRLERLATGSPDDNRVSFGCINLPVSFYEDVAKPAATGDGAIVYVLPEVKTPQQVFGAYDVTDAQQLAAARQRTLAAAAEPGAGRGAAQG